MARRAFGVLEETRISRSEIIRLLVVAMIIGTVIIAMVACTVHYSRQSVSSTTR